MVNPNNNKHFNDEALRINRTLKKENDKLNETIDRQRSLLVFIIQSLDAHYYAEVQDKENVIGPNDIFLVLHLCIVMCI